MELETEKKKKKLNTDTEGNNVQITDKCNREQKKYIYRNNKTSSLKRATKITSLIQTKKKRQ